MRRRRWALLAGMLLCSVGLPGCAGRTPTKEPLVVQATLQADPAVNRDARGIASPIRVRVYELKSARAFVASDFFSVFENPAQTLGSELVVSEEMTLAPGASRTFLRPLHPETRVFGIVAGFRDLEHTIWRASVAVDPSQATTLRATVGPLGVEVTSDYPFARSCHFCFF